jgi:hypothetical protein
MEGCDRSSGKLGASSERVYLGFILSAIADNPFAIS